MMLSFRPFYNVFLFTLLIRCVRCQMISLTFELTLNFGTSFVQKTVSLIEPVNVHVLFLHLSVLLTFIVYVLFLIWFTRWRHCSSCFYHVTEMDVAVVISTPVKQVSEFVGCLVPSVLWHCWFGVTMSFLPLKIDWWDVDVVDCMDRGADCLHMVQLMPLPYPNPIISCLI